MNQQLSLLPPIEIVLRDNNRNRIGKSDLAG